MLCSPLSHNDLQRIFEKLDKNGEGFVKVESLKKLIEKTGDFEIEAEEVECVVGKKKLDFNEFLSFYESISLSSSSNHQSSISNTDDDEKKLEEDKKEDNNGIGFVNYCVERDLVKAFQVFDMNGDGLISSQELECVLKRLGLWDDKTCKDSTTMICVYDTNLDGHLDFHEFKNMMFPPIP